MRSLLILMTLSVTTLGFAKQAGSDIPVTTYLADVDAYNNAYYVQSDGSGAYQNGAGNVTSILVANGYNGIVDGDWRLDLISNSSTRNVGVYLDTGNEVLPGTATPNPPYLGEQSQEVRMETKCTFEKKDMLTMTAGQAFTCPATLRLGYGATSSTFYRLDMAPTLYNYPETQDVHVQCNAVDSGGCNDWFIDPIPVTNPDGSTSPGQTEARLTLVSTHSTTDEGDFYMTFHIRVTRP